ncbi:MAG: two-component sensor histidine kinase, partial [Proteobacteria bacterium]|nr:two-component sensor histidine kinase [Pseudomonadota bacterium]
MDGGQGRLNASLQRKLSVVLSLTIALVALVAGALSFMAAYDEAQELQDDVLRQVAQLLVGQRLAPEPGMALPHFKDHDDNVRLFVHPMGQPNPSGLHVDEGGPLPVPATLRDGLHTLTLNGESFRVLIGSQASGARFVVAQETDLRDAMAQDSALRTVLPFLVLVPVLLLIVITLLRQMFRSVTLLAQEVDAR